MDRRHDSTRPCDVDARTSLAAGRSRDVRGEAVERAHDARDAVRFRERSQHAASVEPGIRLAHEFRDAFTLERTAQSESDVRDAAHVGQPGWWDAASSPLADRLPAYAEDLPDLARRDLKRGRDRREGAGSGTPIGALVRSVDALGIQTPCPRGRACVPFDHRHSASICKRKQTASSATSAPPPQRKLWTTPLQTNAQPSTMTKSSSLQGIEMTGGLSMTMPSPIRIAATAKSIATNGR
jgi:hypothetical protein